jgi:hypothetical protein
MLMNFQIKCNDQIPISADIPLITNIVFLLITIGIMMYALVKRCIMINIHYISPSKSNISRDFENTYLRHSLSNQFDKKTSFNDSIRLTNSSSIVRKWLTEASLVSIFYPSVKYILGICYFYIIGFNVKDVFGSFGDLGDEKIGVYNLWSLTNIIVLLIRFGIVMVDESPYMSAEFEVKRCMMDYIKEIDKAYSYSSCYNKIYKIGSMFEYRNSVTSSDPNLGSRNRSVLWKLTMDQKHIDSHFVLLPNLIIRKIKTSYMPELEYNHIQSDIIFSTVKTADSSLTLENLSWMTSVLCAQKLSMRITALSRTILSSFNELCLLIVLRAITLIEFDEYSCINRNLEITMVVLIPFLVGLMRLFSRSSIISERYQGKEIEVKPVNDSSISMESIRRNTSINMYGKDDINLDVNHLSSIVIKENRKIRVTSFKDCLEYMSRNIKNDVNYDLKEIDNQLSEILCAEYGNSPPELYANLAKSSVFG